MIDWSTCSAGERTPQRVGGAWLFRGTRVPIAALIENLDDDVSIQEFVELFPGVTIEDARAALNHAGPTSDAREPHAGHSVKF